MLAKGLNISQISRQLGCSRKLVQNCIKHFEKYNTTDNKIRKPPPRKTTINMDRQIVRMSERDPFLTSNKIKAKIEEQYNVVVSSPTIRRRLQEAGLRGCIAKKKPLVSKRNRLKRLRFAKMHVNKNVSFWKKILWTDESKFNRFQSDGKVYVRRPMKQENNPLYTVKTVKHGGGNIKVWGGMSWYGVGPLVKIDGILDQYKYKDILQNVMEPYADDNLPVTWVLMHDNDPKHTARSVKSWLEENKINVLEWPPQSPDLNPIENLWNDIGVALQDKNTSNFNEFWEEIQKAWNATTIERCQRLINSMTKRCAEVIKNKGYPTKY